MGMTMSATEVWNSFMLHVIQWSSSRSGIYKCSSPSTIMSAIVRPVISHAVEPCHKRGNVPELPLVCESCLATDHRRGASHIGRDVPRSDVTGDAGGLICLRLRGKSAAQADQSRHREYSLLISSPSALRLSRRSSNKSRAVDCKTPMTIFEYAKSLAVNPS